jgi:hypothetical protein
MDASNDYQTKFAKQEILLTMTTKNKYPKTSIYQQIHLPKTADYLEKKERLHLRRKLDAIPEGLKEQIRMNYVKNQDVHQRSYQKKQCKLLTEFQKLLQEHTANQGGDYRNHSIGGHDSGLYEKMYRIEPSSNMSKAQFLTVMRRVFKFVMDASTETHLIHLFEAFDIDKKDAVDWRSFLCFLSFIIQPGLSIRQHLDIGYAISASAGYLDLECKANLTLGRIKNMIQVPVLLASRQAVRTMIDEAWFELVTTDYDAVQVRYDLILSTFHIVDYCVNKLLCIIDCICGKCSYRPRSTEYPIFLIQQTSYRDSICEEFRASHRFWQTRYA